MPLYNLSMIAAALLLTLTMAFDNAGTESTASVRAHLGKGHQFMQDQRFKEAGEEFEQALSQDASLSEARQQLAICQFELRNYEVSRKLFSQMLAAGENVDLATYYLGRLDLVEQNLESAVRRFKSLASAEMVRDELYYLGWAYFKQEKFPLAVDVLKKASGLNPRDYRSHQLLARAYQKQGKTREAENEFSEAQRLHNYYLQGTVTISSCRSFLLSGQLDKAWEICGPLLETDDVDKLVSIGMLFGKSQDYVHALKAWDKALLLDTDSPEINYNLALTCFHLKNMPRAREHSARAVRLRPEFFEANTLYGTLLYMLAEDEAAIQVLTLANELRPEDDATRKLLFQELVVYSDLLVKKNDIKRAIALMEQAARLRPDAKEITTKLSQLRSRVQE